MKNPTEADYTTTVVRMAMLYGWRVHHTRPARTSDGWRTPVEGHKGLPDLILCRVRDDGTAEVIFAELKTARGVVSPDQKRWLDALAKSPNRTVVWIVPDDLDEIERTLKGQV